MSNSNGAKPARWPFYLGDGLLLGAAYCIWQQTRANMGLGELGLAVLCIVLGALLGIAPALLEYRAALKLAEAGALTTVVAQMKNLEALASQISGATGRWQEVQEQSDRTVAGAREIAERMTMEVKAFSEFLARANESEKATLRLEADKLRRAEADWVHVLVRMLDHVYALSQGALRSGQPSLIEQIHNFQNACRDAARRIGLTPFTAAQAEPFDPQRHQSVEDGIKPPADATVAETIATGYTFQGKMLRPALVRLNAPAAATAPGEPPSPAEPGGEQSQLPLEPGAAG
jgi:molecular chaperone GrpE (heat shock protein)